MSIAAMTPALSELASTVRELPAYRRSMPTDREPDAIDLDLTAQNVLSSHSNHAALRQNVSKVCGEQHCSPFEAVKQVL